jgi:hypothetical protein
VQIRADSCTVHRHLLDVFQAQRHLIFGTADSQITPSSGRRPLNSAYERGPVRARPLVGCSDRELAYYGVLTVG